MAALGTLDFLESAVQKTHEWLKDLNRELHWDDYRKSYQALRAVLHTLRDRLPIEEAVDFGAQLPMIIRGMYYEGWRPMDTPVRLRHLDEFLQAVDEKFQADPTADPVRLATGVFALLNKKITAGEVSDIRSNLPKEIRSLWTE